MDSESIIISPIQSIREIIKLSFKIDSKKRKNALQLLNSILRLAEKRGFFLSQDFISTFRENSLSETESDRLIQKLLDYISCDEIILLTKRSNLNIKH
jgi:hypothetical protein